MPLGEQQMWLSAGPSAWELPLLLVSPFLLPVCKTCAEHVLQTYQHRIVSSISSYLNPHPPCLRWLLLTNLASIMARLRAPCRSTEMPEWYMQPCTRLHSYSLCFPDSLTPCSRRHHAGERVQERHLRRALHPAWRGARHGGGPLQALQAPGHVRGRRLPQQRGVHHR